MGKISYDIATQSAIDCVALAYSESHWGHWSVSLGSLGFKQTKPGPRYRSGIRLTKKGFTVGIKTRLSTCNSKNPLNDYNPMLFKSMVGSVQVHTLGKVWRMGTQPYSENQSGGHWGVLYQTH